MKIVVNLLGTIKIRQHDRMILRKGILPPPFIFFIEAGLGANVGNGEIVCVYNCFTFNVILVIRYSYLINLTQYVPLQFGRRILVTF